MANQSDYMKNRLLQKNQDKVNNARRVLYGVAIYAVLSGILIFIIRDAGFRGVINVLFGAFYFVLAFTSDKKPINLFWIGFIISLIMALFSLLAFAIFPTFIFSMSAYFVYIGIDGAKHMAAQAPAVLEDVNVLDANLWNDEKKV